MAFELYCRVPFGRITTRNPLIRDLAAMLHRTPASIARKLGNFGAFDPVLTARNVSGLAHGSKLDRAIWDEFHADWNGLVLRAQELKAALLPKPAAAIDLELPTGPSERQITTKQRLHQSFFREAVVSSYEGRCCVTGLPLDDCLVAGHIIPWSVDERRRADPTNGLCMSATFDRLFDRGLITVRDDLTLEVCPRIRAMNDQSVVELVLSRHGRPIHRPARFLPDPDCLRWHRKNRFQAA
ncbi:MAG: HNH endonuclease [Planctomycetaceae bacterium]|nr:HNH endonuclease [Planctomycetaceae bacterium]